MPQKFTQDQTTDYFSPVIDDDNEKMQLEPKTETISFLRQFARSYHIEKRLPSSLGGLVLN